MPDVSIEVDDLEAVLERLRERGERAEHGPAVETSGVRRRPLNGAIRARS